MTGEGSASPSGAAAPLAQIDADAPAGEDAAPVGRTRSWVLALGSIGVVFGDIGTSPLYAFREALAHARHETAASLPVYGVASLVIWALILIVTIKYVLVLMRADNRGEGGTLALMALAQKSVRRRTGLVFILGVVGAALFFGDGLITPAISVLSAVEGLKGAPEIGFRLAPYVLPIAAGILVALFLFQTTGAGRVGALFGPIILLWLLALGGLGLWRLSDDLSILQAINPWFGVRFLVDNGFVGFVILGAVFLAVTGAEALYTDMGFFGKGPIRATWLMLVFPCLALNYLGQGALVLRHPLARHNPFWQMAPQIAYWPILILATMATVIASQAMISGAFSMTGQAVQLGLFPRMDIRRTSATQVGQIYAPSVNLFMMLGVLLLLLVFRTSSHLASAYGLAVTGAMLIDTLLAYVIMRRVWKWRLWQVWLLIAPILAVDLVFTSSNLLKVRDGAWLPLVMGAGLVVIMLTWTRGAQVLTEKTRRDSLPLTDLIDMLKARPPWRCPGTAIYLTGDVDMTPVALMHNLKHNKVLHEHNVMMTVRTAETPRVAASARVRMEPVNDDFKKVIITYGFMETPNLPKALQLCRKQGLKFDIMSTSFFLGRRSLVPADHPAMPLWQDKLFILLMKNAANPTDFFKIPPGRVVELGAQVTV